MYSKRLLHLDIRVLCQLLMANQLSLNVLCAGNYEDYAPSEDGGYFRREEKIKQRCSVAVSLSGSP